MPVAISTDAIRRFPLLRRPRPACPHLSERIQEIADLAATAARRVPDGMADAAHALNKAALIASDCGLPDLARELCWQQITVYRDAGRPITAVTARSMLEPVLNLARLDIRADNGDQALRLLSAMHHAVRTSTDLLVDGHVLPIADAGGTKEERYDLRRWTCGLCLRVICANGQRPSQAELDQAITQFRQDEPAEWYAVYRARLGLTVVTLSAIAAPELAGRLLGQVATEAIRAGDGYAARDVLSFRSAALRPSEPQREALATLVTRAGLGRGSLPDDMLGSLKDSARTAIRALAASAMSPSQRCRGSCDDSSTSTYVSGYVPECTHRSGPGDSADRLVSGPAQRQ